jgi:hypothetical protein
MSTALRMPCGGCAQVQLTMVLYDQADYNRARRWRLPKRTIMPGEYQVGLRTGGRSARDGGVCRLQLSTRRPDPICGDAATLYPSAHGSTLVQGFDEFFKDIDDWVRNDRLVVGVQLRLVGRPEVGVRQAHPFLLSLALCVLLHS